MNGHARQPECARTDAVLAIYLDGDVGRGEGGGLEDSGFELVCGDSLRDHLLGCGTCRSQLQRARRLDALLAAQAGRTVDGGEVGALAARWFAAIDAAPVAAAPRRPKLSRVAALALLLPLCLGGIWWFVAGAQDHDPASPSPPPSRSAPAAATPVPPAPAVAPAPAGDVPAAAAPPGEILIASDAAERRARQPRADAVRRPAGEPEPRQVLADAQRPATVRLAAAERLAAAARGPRSEGAAAFEALVETLAGLGDHDAYQRSLHGQALEIVRDDAHLIELLAARLQRTEARRAATDRDELAALTVAARVGERQLDHAIQRAVRRHPSLTEPLAAALRCGVRRTGTAALLLGVWQDLAARGDLELDDTGPCAWFSGQSPSTFAELAQELHRSRSEPQRVRCLLALGQGSDAESLALLLDRLQRAPFLEAHAAAFALSHRPRRQLTPLVAQARADDMFLLRAALARAAVPAATVWTDALALGDAERALLAHGAFPDFPRVASWFRDRALSLGD
jgi:hypothetical protein